MNAYLNWNALRAGLLCAVIGAVALSVQSCKSTSSLQENRTAVRKDSLTQTATKVTTYEPVPITQTSLALDADRLLLLPTLPEGIGLTAHDGRLSLRAESDGKGGVNITAQHEGEERKVIQEEKTTSNRIRDEAENQLEKVKETRHGVQGWLTGTALTLLGIFLIWKLIKYYLSKH